MIHLTYPTASELRTIEQELVPRLTADDPLFRHVPVREVDAPFVMWEQMDSYTGLQQLRGLDGRPPRVNPVGMRRYQMRPGVYGEYIQFTEEEITLRRAFGTAMGVVRIDDLILMAQQQLLQRRYDRIRQIGWSVLQGRFAVSGPGGIEHTDAYPVTSYTAAVPWTTRANAVPLHDFRNVQLFEEGRSVSFGEGAFAYMNRRTFNELVGNQNQADIAGRRVNGAQVPLNLGEINAILLAEGLPQIVVYSGGYLDDQNEWRHFIPTGRVIVIGARSGGPVGEYQILRNATNPGMEPAPYTVVIDNAGREVPRRIEVHDGHNGGPALMYPGSIVNMQVF